VKSNTVTRTFIANGGLGRLVTGTVIGNYVTGNRDGVQVGQGSTVIGNTISNNARSGLSVTCPSNVTNNTVTNTSNKPNNFILNGKGCNDTNNVAP
jgi:hypothetical protein